MVKRQAAPNIPEEISPPPEVKPTPDRPPISIDALLSAAGRWATLIGAAVGLAYVTGYIIVNFYLGALGVHALNILQSRYLATGLLFLFVSFMSVAPLAIGFWSPGLAPEGWSKRRASTTRVVRAILCVLISIGVALAFANFLTGADPFRELAGRKPWEFYFTAAELVVNTLAWALALSLAISWTNSSKRRSNWWDYDWWIDLATAVFIIPLIFAITCVLFASFAYPHIRTSYGGGVSTSAQLVIDPHSDLTTILPMSSPTGTTDTVALVDQTDDGYIVWLTTTQQIIVVPRDAVHAVIVKPPLRSIAPLLLP